MTGSIARCSSARDGDGQGRRADGGAPAGCVDGSNGGDNMTDAHRELKQRYGALYDEVLRILYRRDPVNIAAEFVDAFDEYAPEVGTILPQLHALHSVEQVQHVMYAEFERWFGKSAGTEAQYRDAAQEVWAAWLRHRASADSP